MLHVETVRGWQFDAMSNNIKSAEWIIRMSEPTALTTYRDSGNGWTVLQVVCHLRDFENVYFERARLTVEQENPPLPSPKPDELAAEGRYNEQDLDSALAEWKSRRTAYLTYLRERSASDWERSAMHPSRGPLTLFDQLFLTAMHDTIHMEQMTRILNEKKLS